MFTKRKIVAVTGARSEYDLLSPIFNRLKGDPRFELSLIVTGAHLSDFFGKTINEIIKDDLLISDRIYNLINTNDKIGRIVSIGNQINGIAQSLNNYNLILF
ncbi:MAG: hypothetical protein IPF52_02970 [Saprospiraceae bacterium]|nr:hypothetical protein [Saprospiraceae bacterium]